MVTPDGPDTVSVLSAGTATPPSTPVPASVATVWSSLKRSQPLLSATTPTAGFTPTGSDAVPNRSSPR